jgi:hypothetical protein
MTKATSKYAPPAITEVWWATTFANYQSVTALECNAGVNLTAFVRTMPDLPRTANLVDVSTLDSKDERRQVGTRGGDVLSVEILRDGTTDTAYTTLTEDTAGYLVIARAGLTTTGTFGTGDIIDIFPATVASVADGTPGRNEPDFAVVQFANTNPPSRKQTI